MSTAIDLFAGAGGWDLAARELGIEAGGVEIMKEAVATREAAGLKTIHDDVWTIPDSVVMTEGHIASPPCQTFSLAGKGLGRQALDDVLRGIRDGYYLDLDHLRFLGAEVGDDRTSLVLTPLHYATRARPRWIAWEQVPTALPVWEACAEVLRGLGYSVWTGNLQAEQYGVPQTRKRAFLLASFDREVAAPTPTHSRYYPRDPRRLDDGVPKWISMAEALNGFGLTGRPAPTITGGGTETGGAEPIAKLARYTDRADWQGRSATHMGDVRSSNGCVRQVTQPAPTMTASMDNGNFRWVLRDDLPEWAENRPATTIVGSFKPEIVAAPGYRTTVSCQNAPNSVRVTVEEAGILQSFPADHPWQGAKGKQFLQAGNAIPPMLAMHAIAAAAGIDLALSEVAA